MTSTHYYHLWDADRIWRACLNRKWGNYVALNQTDFTQFIGNGGIGFLPVMLIIFIVVTAVLQFIMKKMPIGRSIHLAGGNPVAAELCGISVSKIIIMIYVVTGILTALGAFIMTCRVGSALPIAGRNYECNAILSVTIGGTSLSGGKGSVLNTIAHPSKQNSDMAK